jgi:hypothetical protein
MAIFNSYVSLPEGTHHFHHFHHFHPLHPIPAQKKHLLQFTVVLARGLQFLVNLVPFLAPLWQVWYTI